MAMLVDYSMTQSYFIKERDWVNRQAKETHPIERLIINCHCSINEYLDTLTQK